jgi:YidC/Oxa1 family membrane protein insertase
MSKKRALALVILLVLAAMLLSSCGMTYNDDGTLQTPTWIAWLAEPLAWVITFVNDNLLAPLGLASYGLAIILVTILLRILLYPLTRKQYQSMKKMQEIQPQMKELQEKYGKDREKLAQKQMELYKEAGVNPAMGCLPLLLQMPVLFAFYYALLSLGPALQEPFLWIPDLSFPSFMQGMSWLQPLTPAHLFSPAVWPYLILPIIYVVSQLIMQRMSQSTTPTGAPGSTNTMMMLMPLMFGYITLITPAALTIYWVTSNILQIIQQGFSTGWSGLWPFSKPAAAPATVGAKAGKPAATTEIYT